MNPLWHEITCFILTERKHLPIVNICWSIEHRYEGYCEQILQSSGKKVMEIFYNMLLWYCFIQRMQKNLHLGNQSESKLHKKNSTLCLKLASVRAKIFHFSHRYVSQTRNININVGKEKSEVCPQKILWNCKVDARHLTKERQKGFFMIEFFSPSQCLSIRVG